LARPLAKVLCQNCITMLKNYFKTAFRNLIRTRVFAIINILGLVLGITGAIVIYKVVDFEKSFDQYHTNAEDVYRLFIHYSDGQIISNNPSIMHPLGPDLQLKQPDWDVSRIHWYYNALFKITNPQVEEKLLRVENGMAFVEQPFFNMFDFDFVAGDEKHLVDEPNTVAMSVSAADKLFGTNGSGYQDLIGRTFQFENQLTIKITGIYNDPPKNTDYGLDYLFFYEGAKLYPYSGGLTSWGTRNGSTRTLIKLPKGVTYETGNQQMLSYSDEYMKRAGYRLPEGAEAYISIQPLSDIHLNEDNGFGRIESSALDTMIIIAVILILIASINFINLATAQSVKRAKEIGIRKVLGGGKKQLVLQFLGEVFLITVLAVVLSLGLSEALLMKLEPFLGYSLGLNLLSNPNTIIFLFLLVITVTLLSGLYPSMVLSAYKPSEAIKSKALSSKKSKSSFSLRRGLVVFQFFFSQLLIIGTVVVMSQMDFMANKDVGFNTEGIVTFSIPDRDEEKLNLFKSRIQNIAGVEEVSYFIATPGAAGTNNTDAIKDPRNAENDKIVANRKNVDPYYGELWGLELLAGEFYKNETPDDQTVINRELAEQLGFENPQDALGQKYVTSWGSTFTIKGVVENFHNRSMHSGIEPLYMLKGQSQYFRAGVQINATDNQIVVDEVGEIWEEVFTDDVFEYSFMTEAIAQQYDTEYRVSELFQTFAFVAIFICCLGLYGLISFMANQKVKEIGIRKVLGASVQSIMLIFTKEVLVLITIAFILAAPLAYLGMTEWLSSFTYRVDLGVKIFVIGAISTLGIAAVTVLSRAMKAAVANPINSLRDE